jgi:hypothetical protein
LDGSESVFTQRSPHFCDGTTQESLAGAGQPVARRAAVRARAAARARFTGAMMPRGGDRVHDHDDVHVHVHASAGSQRARQPRGHR